MKILILKQWCHPEPDLKGLPFAKELVKLGHTVEILTGFPNYPGGKIYPGYKIRFFQKERIDGIDVIRVPLYPSHDSSSLKRILNYFSFAFSAAFVGCFLIRKSDVMYVYHPPATVSFPALFIKLVRRIPFVYDIQDFWPDTLEATGMIRNKGLLKLTGMYLKVFYKFCNHITVLSSGFKEKLLEYSVSSNKISIIYNWALNVGERLDNPEEIRNKLGLTNKFIILFAGTMGKAQGIETILQAAEKLKKSDGQVHFMFIGGGITVESLKKSAKEKGLYNVTFLPKMISEEVGSYLNIADLLLVHLINDKLFEITIPSKTQAYMKIGKPILMGVKGNASELITNANCGFTFQPENSGDLIKKIQNCINMEKEELKGIGLNGRIFYEKNLAIQIGAYKYSKLFESLKNSNYLP